jgi:hypothetical protein
MTTIRCTACGVKFQWSFAEKGKWPDYCDNPECDTFIGTKRADDDVQMPAFLSARTKHHDTYYRNMEKGSEFRAEAAAELSGASASEMAGLKITNLNDRRDAEIAAIPVKNTVSDLMATGVGGFQGADGLAFSAGTQQGALPNVGVRMMTKLPNAFAGGKMAPDRPALETQQPGYRRRG